MTKRFTYCFEPNKISLHGFLERKSIEELLRAQKDAYAWYGTWNNDLAWESLARWIKMLLGATEPPSDALEEMIIAPDDSRILREENVHRFTDLTIRPFEIDIAGLKNIDSSGWASLIHLLNYIEGIKKNVELKGILSHHRTLIRIYQLETLLMPYVTEITSISVT